MKTSGSASRLLLLFSFLLFLLLPSGSAKAALQVTVFPEGSAYVPPIQQYIDQRFNQDIPTASGTLDVHLAECPYASVPSAGCYWDSKTPEIWISKSFLDPSQIDRFRKVFYHELGHHFDFRYPLDNAARAQLTNMFGFPAGTPWGGAVGQISPREWLAEALSGCWYGPGRPYATYGWPYNFYEAMPTCEALAMNVRGDTSWYGRRLVKGTWQTMTVPARRAITRPIRWGGETMYAYYKSVPRKLSKECLKRFNFGRDGYLEVNFCGRSLLVKSTLPQASRIGFYGIPTKAPVFPLLNKAANTRPATGTLVVD